MVYTSSNNFPCSGDQILFFYRHFSRCKSLESRLTTVTANARRAAFLTKDGGGLVCLFDFLSDFLTVVNRNYAQLKRFSIRLALKSVIQLSKMRFPALLYTVFFDYLSEYHK